MDLSFVLGQSITQAIGVTAIIYCLAAMGVNMQFGYTGLLNFGQGAPLAGRKIVQSHHGLIKFQEMFQQI